MQKIITLLIIFFFSETSLLRAQWFDNTFDTDGIVTHQYAPQGSSAYTMSLQHDGKIVLAGSATTGINAAFSIARFNTDGSADTTFGSAGSVITQLGTGSSIAYASVIQPDGKIILTGWCNNGNDFDFGLVRYNTDGTPDTSFDSDGILISTLTSYDDLPTCIALQPDGKIIVGGYTTNGLQLGTTIARYLTDGNLDTTFNGTGVVLTNFLSTYEKPYSIALQTDDKIVLAGGTATNLLYGQILVLRYNSDGTADTTFGTAGRVTTDINAFDDEARAVIVQPDGKIIVTGCGIYPQATFAFGDFIFARYLTDGTLDSTFANNGKKSLPVGNYTDYANSMVLDSNNNIIAAGYSDFGTGTSSGYNFDFALVRLTPTGVLDVTFANNGILAHPIGPDDEIVYKTLIQPDSKILAAGVSRINNFFHFAVVRYLPELNVGINDFNHEDNSVLVYPNPIHDKTVIKYSLKRDEKISFELLNLNGKRAHFFENNYEGSVGENSETLFFPASLARGTYILRVISQQGNASIKIILN